MKGLAVEADHEHEYGKVEHPRPGNLAFRRCQIPGCKVVIAVEECPSWHYLAGPYQNDPERTECPDKDTHQDQRIAHDKRGSNK